MIVRINVLKIKRIRFVVLSNLGCDSITLRTLGVPSYAVKGSDVVLECDYDLEGADLYSVKWYKNGLEFYRYVYFRCNQRCFIFL